MHLFRDVFSFVLFVLIKYKVKEEEFVVEIVGWNFIFQFGNLCEMFYFFMKFSSLSFICVCSKTVANNSSNENKKIYLIDWWQQHFSSKFTNIRFFERFANHSSFHKLQSNYLSDNKQFYDPESLYSYILYSLLYSFN